DGKRSASPTARRASAAGRAKYGRGHPNGQPTTSPCSANQAPCRWAKCNSAGEPLPRSVREARIAEMPKPVLLPPANNLLAQSPHFFRAGLLGAFARPHLPGRHAGPALEGMREGADLLIAEQPGDLRDRQV